MQHTVNGSAFKPVFPSGAHQQQQTTMMLPQHPTPSTPVNCAAGIGGMKSGQQIVVVQQQAPPAPFIHRYNLRSTTAAAAAPSNQQVAVVAIEQQQQHTIFNCTTQGQQQNLFAPQQFNPGNNNTGREGTRSQLTYAASKKQTHVYTNNGFNASPIRRRHPSGRAGRVVGSQLPKELQQPCQGLWSMFGAAPKLTKPVPFVPVTVARPTHFVSRLDREREGPTTRAQAAAAAAAAHQIHFNGGQFKQQQSTPFGQLPPPQRPPVQTRENSAVAGFIGGLKLVQQQHMKLLAAQQKMAAGGQAGPLKASRMPPAFALPTVISNPIVAQHCPGQQPTKENWFFNGVNEPLAGGGGFDMTGNEAAANGGHDGCCCRCGWECPVAGNNDENATGGMTADFDGCSDGADSGIGSSGSGAGGSGGAMDDDDDLVFAIEI